MPEQKDYFKIKAVSSHSLGYFEESPLTFKKFLEEELKEDDKRYLDFGRQVHMRILEPKKFKESYTVLNYELPKSEQQKQFCTTYVENPHLKKEDRLTLAYNTAYSTKGKSDDKILQDAQDMYDKIKDYLTYLTKAKKYKEVLTFAKKQKIDTCFTNAYNHKLANELLFDKEIPEQGVQTYNELELEWDHPLHKNVPCKSMIDRLIIDTNNKIIKLVDIKTTISLKTFKESVYNFNYHRQMAFYSLAVYWYIKNVLNIDAEDYKLEVYIVAIKSAPLHDVKVYKLDDDMLNKGFDEIAYLMNCLSWHFDTDLWEYSREYYEGNGLDKLE